MKRILLATLLLIPLTSLAWDQKPNKPIEQCSTELPWGAPQSSKQNATLTCKEGYALLHDNAAKIPVWVGWTVTPTDTVGCVPRKDAFVADEALPKEGRATPGDYAKSGYDKGHLVPDADLSWSLQTEQESFLMSNMSPQLPNLNRGVWKGVEANTRAWAWGRKHDLTVYAGNIYEVGKSKTIGDSKVVVPEALYKIIIDNVTGESMAFIFRQVEKQPSDPLPSAVSISAVEAATGVNFPVPPGVDKGSVTKALWPVDVGGHSKAKKETCKVKQ